MENAIRIFYIFGYVNSKRETWISRLSIEIALHVEIICRYCTAATLQYIGIRFPETELNRNYIYLRNVPQYICNNAITILRASNSYILLRTKFSLEASTNRENARRDENISA